MDVSNSTSRKQAYLEGNKLRDIIQELTKPWSTFPKPLTRRRIFLLWSFDAVNQRIIPWSVRINSSKQVRLEKSMTKNFVSLNTLNRLIQQDPLFGQQPYGVAINMSKCSDLVLVDFDNCDFDNFDSLDEFSSPNDLQGKLFKSLLPVPAYREISCSSLGCHVLFSHKNFARFLGKKSILKLSDNTEIFLGGRSNKMVIITGYGYQPSGLTRGSIMLRRRFRSSRNKYNFSLKPALPNQLVSFVNILEEELKLKDTNLISPITNIVNSCPDLPNNYSSFKKLELAKSIKNYSIVSPTLKKGYPSILSTLNHYKSLANKDIFPCDKYQSRSELDFAIFCILVKLYKPLKTKQIHAVMDACIGFYLNEFSLRLDKSDDYLSRTCYNAFLFNSRTVKSNIAYNTVGDSRLIKIPYGLFFNVKFDQNEPHSRFSVTMEKHDRQAITNFQWDLYLTLLEQALVNSSCIFDDHSLQNFSKVKASVTLSIGTIARLVTSNKRVPGRYYIKILAGLHRLASTQITWSTTSTKGCISLLEYIYNKETGEIELLFTNLIAFCLLVRNQLLKESLIKYIAFYSNIMRLYEKAQDRLLYRYFVSHYAIGTINKPLIVDDALLEYIYPNFTTRRRSTYYSLFIKNLHRFAKIQGSDIVLDFKSNTVIVNRFSLKRTID